MRATSCFKRSFDHRNKLKLIVSELEKLVPKSNTVLHGLSNKNHIASNSTLNPKFIDPCRIRDNK